MQCLVELYRHDVFSNDCIVVWVDEIQRQSVAPTRPIDDKPEKCERMAIGIEKQVRMGTKNQSLKHPQLQSEMRDR